MQDIQSLIKKYWAGAATMEEQILLLKLLSDDPTSLEQGLRTVYESDLSENIEVLSRQRSENILERILERKEPANSRKVAQSRIIPWSKRWGTWAAAAVILILAGASFLIFSGHSSHRVVQIAVATQPVREVENFSNPGNRTMVVHLKDRSVVALLPGSSISCFQSADTARNINLNGKAYFSIAKDPGRPLTVYANTVATTVLGTEFTISTLIDGKVIVRLVSGKVMVHGKASDDSITGLCLAPGQEAAIDTRTGKAILNPFDMKMEEELSPSPGHRTNRIEGSDMVFDKAPLTEVFDRLRRKYNIPIVYEKQDIKGLRFTGTFLKSDSLPILLSVVCNMNGLTFKQKAGRISIRKLD